MRRFVALAAAAALLATSALAGTVSAGGPTLEVEIVGPETFHDDFLSEECGVDVWTTIEGRVTRRDFDDRTTGALAVNSVNFSLVAQAGDNVFRFRDVGADVVQAGPDGSLTLLIIGQVPFWFSGVLKLNLLTDEVILEPTHWVDTERACAFLTQ